MEAPNVGSLRSTRRRDTRAAKASLVTSSLTSSDADPSRRPTTLFTAGSAWSISNPASKASASSFDAGPRNWASASHAEIVSWATGSYYDMAYGQDVEGITVFRMLYVLGDYSAFR